MRLPRLAALSAAVLAATGCTSPAQVPAPTGTDPAAALAAAVDQFRDQYASGGIVFQLTAPAGTDTTVTRVELIDTRFGPGTVWTGNTVLPGGQTKSLPATLGPALCGAEGDGFPALRVSLADGATALLTAQDQHGVLARVHGERCFADRAGAAVTLGLEDALAPGPSPDTVALKLVVGPPTAGGAAGSFPGTLGPAVLRSVGSTTLLAEDSRAPWPRDVALVPGSGVAIVVRPARCDPHAVAEDKVGTLIPLALDVAGQEGVVKVAASPALRGQLYDAVIRICRDLGLGP